MNKAIIKATTFNLEIRYILCTPLINDCCKWLFWMIKLFLLIVGVGTESLPKKWAMATAGRISFCLISFFKNKPLSFIYHIVWLIKWKKMRDLAVIFKNAIFILIYCTYGNWLRSRKKRNLIIIFISKYFICLMPDILPRLEGGFYFIFL